MLRLAQGNQGPRRHVVVPRGDVHVLPVQLGAAAVGRRRLSVVETARGVVRRPAGARALYARLAREGSAEDILDLRILLPAGAMSVDCHCWPIN